MTDKAPTPSTDSDVLDLDDMVTSRALAPKKVKLFGRQWTIKRDFTAEEIAAFWAAIGKSKDADAMGMIVGPKNGEALTELVRFLPTETMTPLLRRIWSIAGVTKRDDSTEGEA